MVRWVSDGVQVEYKISDEEYCNAMLVNKHSIFLLVMVCLLAGLINRRAGDGISLIIKPAGIFTYASFYCFVEINASTGLQTRRKITGNSTHIISDLKGSFWPKALCLLIQWECSLFVLLCREQINCHATCPHFGNFCYFSGSLLRLHRGWYLKGCL